MLGAELQALIQSQSSDRQSRFIIGIEKSRCRHKANSLRSNLQLVGKSTLPGYSDRWLDIVLFRGLLYN